MKNVFFVLLFCLAGRVSAQHEGHTMPGKSMPGKRKLAPADSVKKAGPMKMKPGETMPMKEKSGKTAPVKKQQGEAMPVDHTGMEDRKSVV